jgi:FKBP-type peptidyl-prolyl cis-trans isomerase
MKTLTLIFFLLVVTFISAQNTKQPVKSQPVANPCKNLSDSFSYALGVQVAGFYRQQGVKKINAALLAKAINDLYQNKPLSLNNEGIELSLVAATDTVQYRKLSSDLTEGKKFLAENKKKPGVITTASGLQYEVLTKGTGPKPTITNTVVCNYKGTLLDGTEFDNSYARKTPAEFALTNVIKGWTEVLQLMPTGSKYKVYVPYQLGYGMVDHEPIPGGSTLVFEIELLSIK